MWSSRGILASALLWLASCSSGAPEPVDPVWGKQACDNCMMLISERRPSAELLLQDGSRKFFDDIGCMVEWLDDNASSVRAAWVRAPQGETWVDAFSAHYRAGNKTPMDYGFLAASAGESFESMRAQIRRRKQERNSDPGSSDHGSAEHGGHAP